VCVYKNHITIKELGLQGASRFESLCLDILFPSLAHGIDFFCEVGVSLPFSEESLEDNRLLALSNDVERDILDPIVGEERYVFLRGFDGHGDLLFRGTGAYPCVDLIIAIQQHDVGRVETLLREAQNLVHHKYSRGFGALEHARIAPRVAPSPGQVLCCSIGRLAANVAPKFRWFLALKYIFLKFRLMIHVK